MIKAGSLTSRDPETWNKNVSVKLNKKHQVLEDLFCFSLKNLLFLPGGDEKLKVWLQ